MKELNIRFDKLSRENRRWRIISAGLAAALVLPMLMGAKRPKINDVVTARQFILVDDRGQIRAQLGTAVGFTHLGLNDKHGKSRIALSVAPNGTSLLEFKGSEGQPIVTLAALKSESAAFSLSTKNVRNLVLLSTNVDGSSMFAISDKNKRPRIVLDVPTGNSASYRLFDENGNNLPLRPIKGSRGRY